MGLFGFFSMQNKKNKSEKIQPPIESVKKEITPVCYEKQMEVFHSLGYDFNRGVTRELIDLEINEKAAWAEVPAIDYIEKNPFSALYYLFGGRNAEIPEYNFSNRCIHFDLEFFDPNIQYKWFMQRMGLITKGEIDFSEIVIETDSDNWEWISFEVNGIAKKWKLEKTGYIADHFVQRFSYLPAEFKTKGRYTYYDDGGQQWVIDYATAEEQKEFNDKTGLNREWLGEGNHFSDPPID